MRGRGANEEVVEPGPGDSGLMRAMGFASSLARKREYSLGPWRSSIATAGDPRRSMTDCTKVRISTRVSAVR